MSAPGTAFLAAKARAAVRLRGHHINGTQACVRWMLLLRCLLPGAPPRPLQAFLLTLLAPFPAPPGRAAGNHTRDTMSPLYRPVPQTLDVSTPAGVKDYYPNLAQV
jgi:hypothetical protein